MKRRAFLGFLGGAAAAGPKLAQGIAEAAELPSVQGGLIGALPSGYPDAVDPEWKARRILALRHWIKGDSHNEARERRAARLRSAEMIERLRLDGLRSVSPQHKYRMLVEGEPDRQRRLQTMWWEDELNSLLKSPF